MRKFTKITFLAGLALALTCSACAESNAQNADQTDADLEHWLDENFDSEQVDVTTAETDLNGDGVPEILVYLAGRQLCGSGGCRLRVLQRDQGGLAQIGSLTITRLPIGVLETSTNGWRDLAVAIGGGGLAYGMVRVPFDGDAYASNPSMLPAERTDDAFEMLMERPPLLPSQLE